nr:unnamed protein product [Callosobruchus chinensis]
MEWSNETFFEFLERYENEPVIWNASLPTHKNRNDIYDAWKRIEVKMGNKYTVTELKKKKDSLMASFRACLNKVKQSLKSGAGTDEIYKPPWFAYEKMATFLRDKDLPRQTRNIDSVGQAKMPKPVEQMYCSEQILIPPLFPYLLRQYAKAAIRTQPSDLLKWSAAYFRCLSLDIPPPVKPRLEYPIPKDFCGITPGWLKALLYQLQNNQTISFKILWDRWTGAYAGAIPWLKFVGLCAAHLTEDLTHTMMLLCEIITEEPEGGSAMISLEIFMELYKFLANIDASKPQKLKNIYFTDSVLSLWSQKVEEEAVKESKEEIAVEEESEVTQESEKSVMDEAVKEPSRETISCPSIAGDEDLQYDIDYYIDIPAEEKEASENGEEEVGEEGEQGEEAKKDGEEAKKDGEEAKKDGETKKEEELPGEGEFEEGETDEELEKYKCALIEDMALTGSQIKAIEHFGPRVSTMEPIREGVILVEGVGEEEEEFVGESGGEDKAPQYEEVWVGAIPGIGPIVPEHLVRAVSEYMSSVAAIQHGMVMPRNVRHYNCPPLEVAEY